MRLIVFSESFDVGFLKKRRQMHPASPAALKAMNSLVLSVSEMSDWPLNTKYEYMLPNSKLGKQKGKII